MSKSWMEALKRASKLPDPAKKDKESERDLYEERRQSWKKDQEHKNQTEHIGAAVLIGMLSLLPFGLIYGILPNELDFERILIAHWITVTAIIIWLRRLFK